MQNSRPQQNLLLRAATVIALLSAAAAAAPADQSGVDHRAHAKPGGPFDLIDWDGDGKEQVTFDASLSHSHYFNAGPPIQNGKIVEYLWTSKATGKVLLRSKTPYMTGSFYVGTTILQLQVTDNTGDKAVAWTYCSVRKPASWEINPPNPESVSPSSSPTYGGALITIEGFGFYNNPVVYFGKAQAKIVSVESNRKMTVEAPEGIGSVPVSVNNGFGKSVATVNFDYYESDISPIHFEQDVVKGKDGKDFSIAEVTSIARGPDGLYYAVSLNGFIHVLEISKDFIVQSYCKSEQIGKNRAITGIAFHPSDHELPPKAFISTSTLYWNKRKTGEKWDNGRVELWQKGAGGAQCMGKLATVVTGLPISDHDHSTSAIDFVENGDMLLASGGTTNAGIHTHGDGIGGIPESPLTGALLRFALSKNGDFDGTIKYDQMDDPGTAHVASGDVEVYASGLRNVFGFTRHSSGHIYGLSNGANSGFGLESTSCTSMGGSVSAQDSLLNIKEGNFYGHPNRNRGRYDERQCRYTAGKGASEGFTPAMTMFGSSTNGILEYTANTFDFQLRGNLFLSKLSWNGPGKVHRVILSEDGEGVKQSTEFSGDGGLSMVMTPYGDLMMPKVKQSKIIVLRAEYKSKDAVHVRAVMPPRGPAAGGHMVMVTGSGFAKGMGIAFGGKPCTGISRIAGDGSSAWCTVPPGAVGDRVAVVATVGQHSSAQYEHGDYEYMW